MKEEERVERGGERNEVRGGGGRRDKERKEKRSKID